MGRRNRIWNRWAIREERVGRREKEEKREKEKERR
jgi:hypothetical protein